MNKTIENVVRFTEIDYTIFGIVLAISAVIGIYFGYINKAKKTVDEYLTGSGKMKAVPVGLSLIGR